VKRQPIRQRQLVLKIVTTLGVLIVLAGCAVDQKKEVATYRAVTDLQPVAPIFEPGQPLSLRDAMLLSNARNERLSIEGENYLQSLIDVRRAVAGFLPTVGLSPSYQFRQDVGSSGSSVIDSGGAVVGSSGGGSSRANSFDVPVGADINLFNGFRDVNALGRNKLVAEQRRALLLDTQEQLLNDVIRVYYQVLTAEQSLRVLRNSIEIQDARLREATGRREAGVARLLDVAQVEAQVSATRVTLIDAQSGVRNARSALALLTGAPVQTSELTDLFTLPADLAALDALKQTAIRRRSDLAAASSAARAARQNVEVAVGQYYPSVSLNLTGYLYRESVPEERLWEGLLRANLPIFSAGLIEADVRQAWSQFRQALLSWSLLHREVMQQVETTFENFTSSRLRLAELRTRVSVADQALRQAEESYNVGLATNLDRITAQGDLLGAQLALVSEQYNQKITYVELQRAVGVLREALQLSGAAASVEP